MTDVMTCGYYPDEPLPGPKERAIRDLIALADEVMTDYRNFPVCCWPKEHVNPITESPMYFPGNAWKGTSGMPQHRYA
jgi:hypothetical protein